MMKQQQVAYGPGFHPGRRRGDRPRAPDLMREDPRVRTDDIDLDVSLLMDYFSEREDEVPFTD